MVIVRTTPDGRLVPFAGRPQRNAAIEGCTSDGDGGSAVDARFCPRRIAMSAQGLLVMDPSTVRRIDDDGTVSRVAGNGRLGRPVDGAPATTTPLDPDEDPDIAAAADGTPLIKEWYGLWTVTPDGRLRRLLGATDARSVSATAGLADGALLLGGLPPHEVASLGADGTMRRLSRDARCGL
jgi:hypothetical protein